MSIFLSGDFLSGSTLPQNEVTDGDTKYKANDSSTTDKLQMIVDNVMQMSINDGGILKYKSAKVFANPQEIVDKAYVDTATGGMPTQIQNGTTTANIPLLNGNIEMDVNGLQKILITPTLNQMNQKAQYSTDLTASITDIKDLANKGYVDQEISGHTHTSSQITDFVIAVQTNRLDQMAVPLLDLNINNNKLINVTDPTLAQDAATKNYVDTRKVHDLTLATASLDMNGQKITNLITPTLDQEAATKKYVDDQLGTISADRIENPDDQLTQVIATDTDEIQFKANTAQVAQIDTSGLKLNYPLQLFNNAQTTQFQQIVQNSGNLQFQQSEDVANHTFQFTNSNSNTLTENLIMQLENNSQFANQVTSAIQMNCPIKNPNQTFQCGIFNDVPSFGNVSGMINLVNNTAPILPFAVLSFNSDTFAIQPKFFVEDPLVGSGSDNVSYQLMRYDDESTKTFEDNSMVSKKYVDDLIAGGGIPTKIENGTTKVEIASLNGDIQNTVAGNLISTQNSTGLTLEQNKTITFKDDITGTVDVFEEGISVSLGGTTGYAQRFKPLAQDTYQYLVQTPAAGDTTSFYNTFEIQNNTSSAAIDVTNQFKLSSPNQENGDQRLEMSTIFNPSNPAFIARGGVVVGVINTKPSLSGLFVNEMPLVLGVGEPSNLPPVGASHKKCLMIGDPIDDNTVSYAEIRYDSSLNIDAALIPTNDFHLVTKKYVDDNLAGSKFSVRMTRVSVKSGGSHFTRTTALGSPFVIGSHRVNWDVVDFDNSAGQVVFTDGSFRILSAGYYHVGIATAWLYDPTLNEGADINFIGFDQTTGVTTYYQSITGQKVTYPTEDRAVTGGIQFSFYHDNPNEIFLVRPGNTSWGSTAYNLNAPYNDYRFNQLSITKVG